MPKFTYTMIFIRNEETGALNGYIPDLAIFAEGLTEEEVIEELQDMFTNYVKLATMHNAEIPEPSTYDTIAKKWPGFRISLITTNIK